MEFTWLFRSCHHLLLISPPLRSSSYAQEAGLTLQLINQREKKNDLGSRREASITEVSNGRGG